MSLQAAIAIAEELATIAPASSAMEHECMDDDALDALLARREKLIWELSAACAASVLAAADADERRHLSELLRRSERSTASLAAWAATRRDELGEQALRAAGSHPLRVTKGPSRMERIA